MGGDWLLFPILNRCVISSKLTIMLIYHLLSFFSASLVHVSCGRLLGGVCTVSSRGVLTSLKIFFGVLQLNMTVFFW